MNAAETEGGLLPTCHLIFIFSIKCLNILFDNANF